MNLNDVVLIGPGSEWFWSMASGIVLAITFIAIYRQLRLQVGAGAVEQMHAIQREWETEILTRHRLTVLLELRDGQDSAKISGGAASHVCDYWERLGYLVRAGHISARLVHEYNGPAARHWWGFLEPAVRAWRVEFRRPGLFEHFEWLAGRMAAIDSREGGPDVDRDYLAQFLPRLVDVEQEAIRAAEQSRAAAGPVAAAPAPAATPNADRRGGTTRTIRS